MKQGIYNMCPSYFGNTKKDVIFEITTTGYDLTGASATLIVTNQNGRVEKTYSVDDGLTIISSSKIQLDEHIVDIPVGRNKYELTITFSDNRVYSFIAGNWEVL